jgi:hypothetical protein
MTMPSMPHEPEPFRAPRPIAILDGVESASPDLQVDPAALIMTCANCGATMDERKCKLICRCGYFLSCSDYY